MFDADKSIAIARATAMGIPTTMDPQPYPYFSWDGTRFALFERSSEEITHEIGHWLVAKVRRRKLPEFGLGSSTYSHSKDTDIVQRRGLDSDKEEGYASALGLVIFADLGAPVWEIRQASTSMGWSQYSHETLRRDMAKAWNFGKLGKRPVAYLKVLDIMLEESSSFFKRHPVRPL